MTTPATTPERPDCTPADIERALQPGVFIPASDMPVFIQKVRDLQTRIDGMSPLGHAPTVVTLYELLLAGVVVKLADCTDPKSLFPGLFRTVFCGWIRARQKAGRSAKETVRQVLQWITDPPCPQCAVPVDAVAKALDRRGYRILADHYRRVLDAALRTWPRLNPDAGTRPPDHVLQSAVDLRAFYDARGDMKAYAMLTESTGLTAIDCYRLAKMAEAKQRIQTALDWVERGLALDEKAQHEDRCAGMLSGMQPLLLIRLGKNGEAGDVAWRLFRESPSVATYELVMRVAPPPKRQIWHHQAMAMGSGYLRAPLDLFLHTQEWARLGRRISQTDLAALDVFGSQLPDHAWLSLAEVNATAAAKLHVAVAFRILGQEHGVDHTHALVHLQKARDLYRKVGDQAAWELVAERIKKLSRDPQSIKPRFARIAAWEENSCAIPFMDDAKGLWAAVIEEPLPPAEACWPR